MKISTTCVTCSTVFERFPAFHRNAEKRGGEVKFCSRACTDKARSTGLIGTKKRRGIDLVCEVCSKAFYRQQSMIQSGKSRFCSEGCRLEAHKRKLVDRTGPRPNRVLGDVVPCSICGTTKYRKRSMLERGQDKTCGGVECRSAYGRSLWGLEPRSEDELKKPRQARKKRPHEFRRSDRMEWIEGKCRWCGTSENLTLDHVVPVCQGGLSTRDNAQTLCGACNNLKALKVDMVFQRQQSQSGGSKS